MPGLVPVTADQLIGEGFPESVTTCFVLTADRVKGVVMSRAPGPAATGLIAYGQDLKGYYIKAKSCDWGPMAGFVCQLPPLNKSGPDWIKFNYEQNLHYVGVAGDAGDFYTANPRDNADPHGPKLLLRTPWVSLVISDARREWLFATPRRPGAPETYLDPSLCDHDQAGDTHFIYGVAYGAGRTVALEYLMVRPQAGDWSLYHGNIYYKAGGAWLNYLNWVPDPGQPTAAPDPELWPSGDPPAYAPTLPDCRAELDRFLRAELGGPPTSPQVGEWRPIHGIQNPFPVAYAPNPDDPQRTVPVESPLNAVVGDYDLFGVWPQGPPSPIPELIRYTERSRAPVAEPPSALFAPVQGKPLAVRSTISPHLIVECVAGDTEIAQASGLGNISELVAVTAGTLNSFATYLPKFLNRQAQESAARPRPTPNRAFHSDDGGRPDLWRVEMPVAVFLPHGLDEQIGLRRGSDVLVLRSALDLAQLIDACATACTVTLNLGWVAYMFALCTSNDAELRGLAADPTRQPGSDFAEVIKEQGRLGAGGLETLAELLARRFTPGRTAVENSFFDRLVADSIEFIKAGGNQGRYLTAPQRVMRLLRYRTGQGE